MLIIETGRNFSKGGDFTEQALDLLLARADIKKEESNLRVYDVIAVAIKSEDNLKKQQTSLLKDLAKYLYPIIKKEDIEEAAKSAEGEEDEDEKRKKFLEHLNNVNNGNCWIPVELEKSPKYRKKLVVKPKQEGKQKVYYTNTIRLSSPEQVLYWLEKTLGVDNSSPDNSWYLSAETCSVLLWFLATNQHVKGINAEAILENLATPGKGSGRSKGYKKAESLEAKLAAANKRIAELEEALEEKEKEFSEYTLAIKEEIEQQEKSHKEECSSWKLLFNYLLLKNLYLGGIVSEQKETISDQAVRLDIYSEKDRLVLENAPDLKEFWDLVVDIFKQEMINPSKALYSVRDFIENSSRLVIKQGSYRKVRILEVEGFEPMPLDEDDIKTVGKPMGSIFRCLLNKPPKTSGANLYPESYARLCQWFAYKCSRYNPKQWFPSTDKFRFSVKTGELSSYGTPKRNYLSNEELINLPSIGAAA